MQPTDAGESPDLDLAVNDLGPLAWVLDELRTSLDGASKALKRFVRDSASARDSDLAAVDTSHLRIARQQLHQAVGALEMVGLAAPAQVLRAMETAVQRFVEKPELCTEDAAAKVERASFALTEYLEGVLGGKDVSPIALFPQYRDVQQVSGSDRIHPADLWQFEWRWIEPELEITAAPRAYDAQARALLDTDVLKLIKTGDIAAAQSLKVLSLGLAAAQTARQPRAFWKICAGFFEAVGIGLVRVDVYVKRAGSRILLQYTTLSKGDLGVSDRLAQDLLFFCAQAKVASINPAHIPALAAVREAYGLARFKPIDYEVSPFGRFDPAMLAQARKRITAAKENWSALAGGDVAKMKGVSDQFSLVADSLVKLHPASKVLSQALPRAIEGVVKSGVPPGAELAMEVATSLLYLEAAFEDLDPTDPTLASRTGKLAERLELVRQGAHTEALEPWMEELYRRVSDRQTMGSVVGELRTTLADLEKCLDQFFRDPQNKTVLRAVPGQLSQMRGVLSVLGLDQASHAVARMRESVEEILVDEVDEEKARAAGTFDKLGNNLGALGFLIDMLNYQPALAKKLFVYDEAQGELKPLMGRTGHAAMPPAAAPAAPVPPAAPAPAAAPIAAPVAAAPAAAPDLGLDVIDFDMPSFDLPASPAPAPAASAPAAPAQMNEEDTELRDIFLEEAREVIVNGNAAIDSLQTDPGDVSQLTTIRRAFHTLKGSSRMVGLNEFGEAGWALEQLFNTWLADQKSATDDLLGMSRDAFHGFGLWAQAISDGTDAPWKTAPFKAMAEAMQHQATRIALELPAAAAAQAVPEAAAEPVSAAATGEAPVIAFEMPAIDLDLKPQGQDPAPQLDALPSFDFDMPDLPAPAGEPAPQPFAEPPSEPSLLIEPVELIDLDAAPPPQVGEDESVKTIYLPPTPAPRSAEAQAPAMTILLPRTGPSRVEAEASSDMPSFDLNFEPTQLSGAAAVAAREPEPAPSLEVEGIDFGSLSAATGPAAPAVAAPAEQKFAELAEDLEFDTPAAVPEAGPVDDLGTLDFGVAPATESALEPAFGGAPDEQVKVIGPLRIGIPLYNVFLNEADEWSRRLSTEIGEWAMELHQQVPDSCVALAHSLAGSSATVGFSALSDMARALEHSLQGVRHQPHGTPEQARVFTDAAEDIRRLLHQFAAGFLKEPDTSVIDALKAVEPTEDPAANSARRADELDVADGINPAFMKTQQIAQPEIPQPAAAHVAAAASFVAPAAALEEAVPAGEGPRDVDDDIDVADAIDPDLFPIFEEEAQELLPSLSGALRQWSARPDNNSARDAVLRALHTLKGSARLSGALRLGEMAHRIESDIERLGSGPVQGADVEPLVGAFDTLQASFDTLRGAVAKAGEAPAAVAEEILPADPVATSVPGAEVAVAAAVAPPGGARTAIAMPSGTLLPALRPASNQSVRVRSQLLDRLVNQAGEVMITRSRLEAELSQLRGSLGDLTGNLDRLRSQLRDIELQAESQMQSRLAQAKDSAQGFDPLEFDRFTRVQELTRMMAESVNDVATVQRSLQRTVDATEDDLIAQARQTRELQRDLLRTRMVEFEGISERLYRVVRQASKDAGKQVKLDITGGSIEMDRGVLDRMTPAFEHLLRNCVAHGIEDAQVRTAHGKDAVGTITIGLRQEGNDVSVEFRDDGGGLNLQRIREKAVSQGLIGADQQISNEEAANLVFMPGFSTAATVTELAGRGIGMDVVRSEVNALGGRIETTTEAGRGTSFRLVLPLTTAVTQVVMLRSGQFSVGVPATVVETVRRAPAADVQRAYNSGTFEFGGESMPFFWSGALLQSSARSVEPQARTMPVVIFRSAAQRIAVHVDEVLGNQEVVVKNLGPQLARLPGLAGMSVLASGAVALIYNPVALAAVYGEQARALGADRADPTVLGEGAVSAEGGGGSSSSAVATVMAAQPAIPLVLVVDDSITVRRVTQRLLQREGYRVALAADGLLALEKLADELPAIVLSDIEMPRMDGFDLARNIRGDARLKHLPIVMITSRIAEKHREHAMELGVNHYLGKPYSEEELMSIVKHYAGAKAAA